MVLPETTIMAPIGIALVVLASQFLKMERDEMRDLNKDLSEAYKNLRDKILDPILLTIIINKKAKIDPEKFMITPEVTGEMLRYRTYLNKFNELSSKKLGVIIPLQYAITSSACTGISVIILTALNEFYINSLSNTIHINTSHVFALTLVILIIGSIFMASFIINYRKYNNEFRVALNDVTGGFY